jgi:hypothetical protein
MDEQRLVPGRVTRRRDDRDAAVAEDVEVAVELADRTLRPEGWPLVGRESPISDGFTPTSASCAARVLARVAVPVGVVTGFSATASG